MKIKKKSNTKKTVKKHLLFEIKSFNLLEK